MHILIFTGNAGAGITQAATATAAAAAAVGQRTLLASMGPSHGLSALLGQPISNASQPLTPRLSAWELSASENLAALLEMIRPRLFGPLTNLSGDELPLIPGIDFLISLYHLRQEATANFDLVVLDAGPHDTLLRVLDLPDAFRWLMRLLLGLDRGPGRNPETASRSLIPGNLMPFEWVGKVQEARVKVEQLRDAAIDVNKTTVRYVLRPDAAALSEARLALPALYLHGLAVDNLITGPLLPADLSDSRFTNVLKEQQEIAETAKQTWQICPVSRLPLTSLSGKLADWEALGKVLYADSSLLPTAGIESPITIGTAANPFLALQLPGLVRNTLSLTLSEDELIVQVGPYRRHILMPDSMRGKGNIKATREGDKLVITMR